MYAKYKAEYSSNNRASAVRILSRFEHTCIGPVALHIYITVNTISLKKIPLYPMTVEGRVLRRPVSGPRFPISARSVLPAIKKTPIRSAARPKKKRRRANFRGLVSALIRVPVLIYGALYCGRNKGLAAPAAEI